MVDGTRGDRFDIGQAVLAGEGAGKLLEADNFAFEHNLAEAALVVFLRGEGLLESFLGKPGVLTQYLTDMLPGGHDGISSP